jgi:4-hydroxyphenylpyruvate dioxygenase-like putative hemolysin
MKALKNGAISIEKPKIIKDKDGFIEIAVIKPNFCAWRHSLIDLSNYYGKYLPNHEIIEMKEMNQTLSEIDHLAIAIEKDTLLSVLEWYKTSLGLISELIQIRFQ